MSVNHPESETTEGKALRAPNAWEAAYLRFETPEQEIRKFRTRLLELGAERWSRDSHIVELCCGRGSGLRALHTLGFTHVEGIDLSPTLAEHYEGPGTVLVADCRNLPFKDASRDVVIVQGGLHHLLDLPEDLDRALCEAARVLRHRGLFVVVEPWLTPFLWVAHAMCGVALARRVSRKVDALATMIEHENRTYDQWLGQPEVIRASLKRFFEVEFEEVSWGKLRYIGRKR